MQDGLYVIAGETFDGDEVIAGFRLFKKLKKSLGKITNIAQQGLKVAAPALGVASMAFPALAPAAAAAAMASRLSSAAQKGSRPARAAMRMMARHADRGDPTAQRFMNVLTRVERPAPRTLLNAVQVREIARRARKGNHRARRFLVYIARLADRGDPASQALLEQAAGTTRWDLAAGHDLNADLEIMNQGCGPVADASGFTDIVSGGPIWDYVRPRRGYRAKEDVFGPRDAYRLGLPISHG